MLANESLAFATLAGALLALAGAAVTEWSGKSSSSINESFSLGSTFQCFKLLRKILPPVLVFHAAIELILC